MGKVGGAFIDAFSVVIAGLKLIVAHLPVLLTIYLVGAGLRNGILWAAVELSENHPTTAWFLLPLAPLATLTSFVLMLRVVSPSLRHAAFGGAGNLGLLASTLIPFLTVYAAQGRLKEDYDQFVNHAVYRDILTLSADSARTIERLSIAQGGFLVSLVIVAFGLRFLISRFDLAARHLSIGGAAAYLEVLWMLVLARTFTRWQDHGWEWLEGRRFVQFVSDTWGSVVDWLGPLGAPAAAVVDRLGAVIDDADDLLLIPLAWLTVGAVALGGAISLPDRPRRVRAWDRPARRLPRTVRRWGAELGASLTERFRSLSDGFRLLALGGLLPMLLFCVVFVLSDQAGVLVDQCWRWLVGPRPHTYGLAFTMWRELFADAARTVVLVGLLAAAIDRILGGLSRVQPEMTESSPIST